MMKVIPLNIVLYSSNNDEYGDNENQVKDKSRADMEKGAKTT